jgi:oxygen-dependent protoporphyrinogen oxidase
MERNPVVGGNVISKSDDSEGFVWEEGPNSFQPTPAICQTIHELGITEELVLADGSLPRFVYYHGNGAGQKLANLHALPTNLPGDLLDFNLLTWPGKIRAGLGAIGFIAPPPPDDEQEESVREFVTRHLGKETFERIIDPFVSGVYAGDPDELAMRAALRKIHRLEGLGPFGPGLVSGAVARFQEIAQEKKENPPDPAWPTYRAGELGSFQKGLQTLPNKVAEILGNDRVKTSRTLEKVEKMDDGRFKATFATTENDKDKEIVIAKAVSLTSPTRVTAKVAADLIPAAAR